MLSVFSVTSDATIIATSTTGRDGQGLSGENRRRTQTRADHEGEHLERDQVTVDGKDVHPDQVGDDREHD